MKAVPRLKIRKVPAKSLPVVCKPCRYGQPRARADENGISGLQRSLQPRRLR